MKNGLRVLFLARFFLSGQTTHLVSLARGLRQIGISVSVATQGRIHPQAWESYSRTLHDHGIHTLRASNIEQLDQLVHRLDPHVIHTHSSDMIPLTLDLCRAHACASVLTCHGLGVAQNQARIKDVDAVIAPGPQVEKELRAAGLNKVYVIRNGVDVDHFRPQPKAKPYQVVYLGRVDTKKRPGLHELIRACDRLFPLRLIVASNDRPAGMDRNSALGWVDDPAQLLSRSHAVFGTGRALREGMAAGCVAFVLGETYGGIVGPDHKQHRRPCFSGKVGAVPSADQMRTDLIRLFQDKKKYHQLASWSRQYAVSHFCIKSVAKQTVEVYQRVGGST